MGHPMGNKLDMTLAILNGLVGDHLARTNNALATELAFVHEGREVPVEREALAKVIPSPKRCVAVFVHGLMCTETVWRFADGQTDYGTLLEADHGYTALRVRYNSGRPIADNGAALEAALERLVAQYPGEIDELLLVGFSMGGLVIRSACHVAAVVAEARGERARWLDRVKRIIYVGTPHRGAPLERAGRVLVRLLRVVPDPYTRLIADIADIRSGGLKDLGDADLTHEARELSRLTPRFALRDPRHPVPLLPAIQHYLAAGTLLPDPRLALWFGDVLVPVHSATADSVVDKSGLVLPPEHVAIFEGYSHVRLAHDPSVYERIRAWAEPR